MFALSFLSLPLASSPIRGKTEHATSSLILKYYHEPFFMAFSGSEVQGALPQFFLVGEGHGHTLIYQNLYLPPQGNSLVPPSQLRSTPENQLKGFIPLSAYSLYIHKVFGL